MVKNLYSTRPDAGDTGCMWIRKQARRIQSAKVPPLVATGGLQRKTPEQLPQPASIHHMSDFHTKAHAHSHTVISCL